MGGPGSGRLFHFDRQFSLDECLWIDICDWKRRGLLVPGMGFSWTWFCRGERTGQINVRAGHEHVWLSYRVRRPGEDWRDISSTIDLASTPCHFGGQRVWFRCPGCGDRAQKLYMHAAYFRCRTCCGLPYASQQETPLDRGLRKSRKLRGKLGDDGGLGAPILWKPKGMHWRTFKTLRKQIAAQEEVVEIRFVEASARLLGGRF
jgi:hypothetical protein